MRADMGGAACVVGTILASSSLKMKVNIKGIHSPSFFFPMYLCLHTNLPSNK